MEKVFKGDFPILKNSKFSYLDSGATSQHPTCVLNDVISYYKKNNANPHRGSYSLSVKATKLYENAREGVKNFINAKSSAEIIFTKNATESLNLIAYSYGLNNLKKGDEIVLSIMEHHSMIVPFQMVAKKTGATLKYIYLNDDFCLDEQEIEKKITKNTKIVGISTVSNVLGTKNDVKKIVKKAHSVGAVVVCDASQSIAHMPLDVQNLDVDFAVFSGHKMFAPLGIGVLFGKQSLLLKMPPFLFGGDMIEYVDEQNTTFAPLPQKFEAGTQNVGGAVGLLSAINYINEIGYKEIQKYENNLTDYAYKNLTKLKFLEVYATKNKENRSSVLSFNIKGIHAHDVSSILDLENVFVRSGNHCAQPLLKHMKVSSTIRASFSIYNTKQDVDNLVFALNEAYKKFKKYIKD
ncbi:MAG: cysteine desulfurase [Clostridia bacterium]|nr:cysteine desulfurase [Clostridia bacterium]